METSHLANGLIQSHDLNSYSPPKHTGILNIPTEILLIILHHATDASLYSLSLLSKRLHYLALPIYLTRNGISDHNDTLYLMNTCIKCIPALRTALFITSYHSISCIFREAPISVLNDMRQLTGLLSKLTHVDEMDLNFNNVFWPRGTDCEWNSNSDVWNHHFGALLSAIAERSCESLTIRAASVARFIHRHLDTQFKEYSRSPFTRLARVLGGLFPEPRNGRVNNPLPCKTLKVLHITSSLPFYRPFLRWTLSTLKHSSTSIVTLILDNLSISHRNWSLFLPRITLPALSKLSLKSCSLRFADFSRFLLRHRINILELCWVILDSRTTSPPPLPMTVLSHLTSLCGSNEYLPGLLQPIDAFPNLTSIAIHPSIGGLRLYIEECQLNDDCLRHIAQLKRSSDKYVHVETTIFPDALFHPRYTNTLAVHPETMESRIERSLYCLRSLELRSPASCLPEPDMLLLPRWLALFPSLVEVAFAAKFLPSMSEERTGAFVKAVAEACPRMRSLSMENQKRNIEEWIVGASVESRGVIGELEVTFSTL